MKQLMVVVTLALLVAFATGVALQPYAAVVYDAVVTAAKTEAERDQMAIDRTVALVKKGQVGGHNELRLRDALGVESEMSELRGMLDVMGQQLHEQDRVIQGLLAQVHELNYALAEEKQRARTLESDVGMTVHTLHYEGMERFTPWGTEVFTKFVEHVRVLEEVNASERTTEETSETAQTPPSQRKTIEVAEDLILEVFEDGNGMLFRTIPKADVPYGIGALALCHANFNADTVPSTAFGGVAVSTKWDQDVLCLNAITSHERNQDIVAPVLSQRTADGMLNIDAWKRMRHGDITVPVAYITNVATSTKTVAELLATK
jgi:hypothetical protein